MKKKQKPKGGGINKIQRHGGTVNCRQSILETSKNAGGKSQCGGGIGRKAGRGQWGREKNKTGEKGWWANIT